MDFNSLLSAFEQPQKHLAILLGKSIKELSDIKKFYELNIFLIQNILQNTDVIDDFLAEKIIDGIRSVHNVDIKVVIPYLKLRPDSNFLKKRETDDVIKKYLGSSTTETSYDNQLSAKYEGTDDKSQKSAISVVQEISYVSSSSSKLDELDEKINKIAKIVLKKPKKEVFNSDKIRDLEERVSNLEMMYYNKADTSNVVFSGNLASKVKDISIRLEHIENVKLDNSPNDTDLLKKKISDIETKILERTADQKTKIEKYIKDYLKVNNDKDVMKVLRKIEKSLKYASYLIKPQTYDQNPFYACDNNDLNSIAYFFLCEPDSYNTLYDEYGLNLLHYACQKDKIDVVDFLFSNGANLEDTDKFYKRTPLHIACVEGNYKVVYYLIEKGANINAKAISYLNMNLGGSLLVEHLQMVII